MRKRCVKYCLLTLYTMPKIVTVCSNLIEKENNFLVVRETKDIAKNLYNFPSGTLENNESLVECATREAKEETGLTVIPKKIVSVFQIPFSALGNNIIIIVFKSDVSSGTIKVSKEHPTVKYVSYDELRSLNEQKLLRHNSYMLHTIDNFNQDKLVDIDLLRLLS